MANVYPSKLSGGAQTGGNALPAEVLSGKTFTNDNGAQTGTMTNNGAVTQTIQPGASYTIPEGYHNGTGTVTADNATITADTTIESITPANLSSTGFTGATVGKTYLMFAYGTQSITNWSATWTGATELQSITGSQYYHAFLVKATATTIKATLAQTTGVTAIYVFGLDA